MERGYMSCMKKKKNWKTVWPELSSSRDFDPDNEFSNLRHVIVDLERSLGFEDVDQANVSELQQSH